MDDFVQDKLREWNLSGFISRFEEAGVDREVFEESDILELDLFDRKKECGYFEKFKKRFIAWKNDISKIDSSILLDESKCNNACNPAVAASSEAKICNSPEQLSMHAFNETQPILLQTISPDVQTEIETKSVRDLLTTTTLGKLIMAIFHKKKIIDSRKLISLVILYEMDHTPNYRIKTSRLAQLAAETGEIFATNKEPAERIAQRFYFPFQKAEKGRKAVSAGGAFYDKYLNLRRHLIENGLITPDQYIPNDIRSSEEKIVREQTLLWLHDNDSPQEEVVEKWSSTVGIRNPPGKKVRDYFLLYKGLRSQFGHILLSIDFDNLYPEFPSLESNWQGIASLLIQCARNRFKLSSSANHLIEQGQCSVAGLLILPNLLGTICRKRKSQTFVFGNTLLDVQQSFIYNAQTKEDFVNLKTLRSRQIEQNANYNIGPYIVFIGDLKNEGDADSDVDLVIIIEGYEYIVSSNKLSDAVDYCIKAIKYLGIDFAVECKHIWFFLTEYVYKIPKAGKVYASVESLIKEIEELKEKSLLNDTSNII